MKTIAMQSDKIENSAVIRMSYEQPNQAPLGI
jgi:hypothetical protein